MLVITLQQLALLTSGSKKKKIKNYFDEKKMATGLVDLSPPIIKSHNLHISVSGGTSIITFAILIKQNSQESFVTVKKYKRKYKELAKAEIEFLQRLSNHRNIIGFYGIVESEDEGLPDLPPPLIVLERAKMSLKQYIEELRAKGATLKERALYMSLIQITQGIQHMHNHYVAHLDIKPANILITEENGEVIFKLCDFGTSEDIHPGRQRKTTEGNEVKGTYSYMAPEMYFKTPAEDTRLVRIAADIFSFSITAWELTVLKEPFAGMIDSQIMLELSNVHRLPESETLAKGLPSLPTIGLPSPIQKMLTGCWKNYKHRWNIEEVLQTLGKE